MTGKNFKTVSLIPIYGTENSAPHAGVTTCRPTLPYVILADGRAIEWLYMRTLSVSMN